MVVNQRPSAGQALRHVAGTAQLCAVCLVMLTNTALAATPAPKPTLIDAWLSKPALAARPAPYQYIRGRDAAADIGRTRDALVEEFDALDWRLGETGHVDLRRTVAAWRERIAAFDTFRTPGAWGPASLLANPAEVPPLARVDAIGACARPDWVEIWDRHGIRRIPWERARTLSTLLDNVAVDSGQTGRLVVVRPDGSHRSYGVQGWNFYDTTVTPGTRLIAALPLGGRAPAWIQQTIADVVAHTPSGADCREAAVVHEDE